MLLSITWKEKFCGNYMNFPDKEIHLSPLCLDQLTSKAVTSSGIIILRDLSHTVSCTVTHSAQIKLCITTRLLQCVPECSSFVLGFLGVIGLWTIYNFTGCNCKLSILNTENSIKQSIGQSKSELFSIHASNHFFSHFLVVYSILDANRHNILEQTLL